MASQTTVTCDKCKKTIDPTNKTRLRLMINVQSHPRITLPYGRSADACSAVCGAGLLIDTAEAVSTSASSPTK